ncbi:MAG: flavin reductase [Pseudomonadota bacterium]
MTKPVISPAQDFPATPAKAAGVDTRLFRETMSAVAGGVTVLTTDGPAGRAGLTATAMASVSDAPPTLLVCVNRTARSHAALVENGVFAVNVLAAGSEDLAAAFAGAGDLPADERFGLAGWTVAETGAPLLDGALAVFDCTIVEVRTVSTHDVILGQVAAARSRDQGDALVYWRRGFHTLREG